MKLNTKVFLAVFVGLASQAAFASDLALYCGNGREDHDRQTAQIGFTSESNGQYHSLSLKGEDQKIVSVKFVGGSYRAISGGMNYIFKGECGDGDTASVTITSLEGRPQTLPCQCDED